MLSPNFLYTISDEAAEIFLEAEMEIVKDVAARIARMGAFSETSAWQMQKVREAGVLQGKTSKLIASAGKQSQKTIVKLMKEAAEKGLAFDDKIYRMAGLSPMAISASPALQAVFLQGANDTLKIVGNYTKTMAETAQKAFYREIDKAYLQIITGAQSPQTAIKKAVNEIASNGLEKIAYPSGSMSSVESAVRRAVTTGINQSVSKLQLARAEELDTDLVEVTSHSGARPEHAEWQGQVYSLRGKTRGYKDFYSSTGYGDGDGLCGWNCYHSFYPFFEGLSTKAFSRDPSAEAGLDNDEEYELNQKQRYYERQIRSAKKEVQAIGSAIDSSSDDEIKAELRKDFDRASSKLKTRRESLTKFLEESGRIEHADRELVSGWNRSISARAVWGARRYG